MGQVDSNYINECRKRAERGDCDAYYNLGRMYCTGHGVPMDLVEAHKWFNLAAVAGKIEAKVYREEISSEMSPDEVAAAQRSARQWVQTH
ncbi:MAG: hypothetical protein ABF335_11540 [Alphaproteobacteria bacterium]